MEIWDEHKDVVIIGSGLAGLSAAIEARQAGASVLELEKMKVTGGNTRISDGGVAAPNNFLQKKRGVQDSPEIFCQDMLRAGLHLNHPALVSVLAENAAEAVEWSRELLGVRYLDRLDRFGGHSVARCLTTRNHTGVDFIKPMTGVLKQKGVEIRTRCFLKRLLADEDGSITGVQIRVGYAFPDKESGEKRNIRAHRGVILATGGFGNDIRFRSIHNPQLDDSVASTNHAGATAEGLIAALAVKAAPIHLSRIQLGPWGCVEEKRYGRGARFAAYSVYPAGILVDPATGRRIVNEWTDRRLRCEAIFKTGNACVGIVDAAGAELDPESLHLCLKRGYVKGYATIAELASEFAMPQGQLEATVRRYNHAIQEGGPDPFGKPLVDGAKMILKPPFYAICLWPKVHFTSGGVGINSKTQVVDPYGRPIAHLFAAGEVCGGIHGASRLGNCALTECMVFGRIAGQRASG
jgi:flavocytochrome c